MTEQESAAKQAQQWFVRRGDKEHGPFTSKQLRSMAASGKITVDDLLRKGDTSKWVKACSVKGLFVPNEDAQSHPATAVTPDQTASTSTSEMPAGTFSEWYKTLWVSRLPFAAQVGVWLLYGWIWMPALYLARTKSVSIAFKVIGCIVLLSLLLPAIRNAREAARKAERRHDATTTVSNESGSVAVGDELTGDAVELTTPTLVVTPEYGYDDIFVTNNAELLLVGYREVWHVPTSTKLTLPDAANTWKWLRAAVSPDGRFLAASVVTVDKNDIPTGTQLQIFSLDGHSAPVLLATHELHTPNNLPKNIESPVTKAFSDWTKIIWSRDCSTVSVASRFAVNVVTSWQKQVSVMTVTHPEISTYSGQPSDFSGFVQSHQDEFSIASISCSHDGRQIAVCYRLGGVEVHSTTTKQRKFLAFPRCLTTWSFEAVEFAPSVDVAVAVARQESGWTGQQGQRVFHTSRHWTFVWNTTDWSLVRSFGPVQQDSPNDDSSPQFIGMRVDPLTALLHKRGNPTTFEAIEVMSGRTVGSVRLDDVAGRGWDASLSANGRFLLVRQGTGPYRVFDTSTNECVTIIMDSNRVDGSDCIALSDDGRLVAIGNTSGLVRLWNRSTGRSTDSKAATKSTAKETEARTTKNKSPRVGGWQSHHIVGDELAGDWSDQNGKVYHFVRDVRDSQMQQILDRSGDNLEAPSIAYRVTEEMDWDTKSLVPPFTYFFSKTDDFVVSIHHEHLPGFQYGKFIWDGRRLTLKFGKGGHSFEETQKNFTFTSERLLARVGEKPDEDFNAKVPESTRDAVSGITFPTFEAASGTWTCRKTGKTFQFKPKIRTGPDGKPGIARMPWVKHEISPFTVTQSDEIWVFEFHQNGAVYAIPERNVDSQRARIGQFTFDGKVLDIKLALTALREEVGKIPWEFEFELARP